MEKVVEIPEIWMAWGTQTSGSLGTTETKEFEDTFYPSSTRMETVLGHQGNGVGRAVFHSELTRDRVGSRGTSGKQGRPGTRIRIPGARDLHQWLRDVWIPEV